MDVSSKVTPNVLKKVRRILVVDDDEDLAQSYRDLLEAHGLIVHLARNGVEALKRIMRFEIDAIVCDLMMPHMAGDMFYMAVERTKPDLCKRFIFITGYEGDPEISEFIQRVNGVVLYKPVTIEKILATLTVLANRFPADAK